MARLPEEPSPPVDFPDDAAVALRNLTDHELREAIVYAQELLLHHHQTTDQIEPAPGEEILELREHPGYTEVVKRQPCGNKCDECPHGPYVYHVTRERHPNGDERFHWVFLGRKVTEPAE